MDKSTDDLDTYTGRGRVEIPAPSGRHRGEPIQTPGRYGWNPSPEHIARVDAEVKRMREQSARRRAATAARKAGDAR